jgi:anti-sigma-K factor RskA
MMSEMNNERFEDLKDAYVLGALPEEERLSFEDYLAAHPERQAEIDELGAVAGLLAFSPQDQEPSPELRDRVMEVVQAEAEPRRAGRQSTFVRLRDYLSFRSLALGAAALLVIGLLSWNVVLQGQVDDLQGRVQHAQGQVQDLQAQVEDRRDKQQIQQSRTIELEGSWADQGAHAEVAFIHKNQIILVARNLPAVPEDRTCQIWVISNDVPTPSGLFQPDGNMTATPITNSITKADGIAVTVERAGGSKKPTSAPVLSAKL